MGEGEVEGLVDFAEIRVDGHDGILQICTISMAPGEKECVNVKGLGSADGRGTEERWCA